MTISKKVEKISKEVLDIMTQEHHNGYGCMSLMEKLIKEREHDESDVCKALAFLCSEKLLNLNETFKGPYAKYFELLDEDGHKIKNTMVGVYHDDESFGIIYYDPRDFFKKNTTCHEHLEQQVKQTKSIIDEKCVKCFEERAERICLAHNQSLEFCQKCKNTSNENLELGKILGFEQVWQKIKTAHHAKYWAN